MFTSKPAAKCLCYWYLVAVTKFGMWYNNVSGVAPVTVATIYIRVHRQWHIF